MSELGGNPFHFDYDIAQRRNEKVNLYSVGGRLG